MAFLRNRNGENYKIIGSRPSSISGHKDYLVQSKSGGITVAKCWSPKDKCWAHGEFYGWGDKALKEAKKAFSADPLSYTAERISRGKLTKRK